MKGEKLEGPFHLDMAFGEALARFVQTKPEEVKPPPGRKAKGARPEPGAPDATAEDGASDGAADSGASGEDPEAASGAL